MAAGTVDFAQLLVGMMSSENEIRGLFFLLVLHGLLPEQSPFSIFIRRACFNFILFLIS